MLLVPWVLGSSAGASSGALAALDAYDNVGGGEWYRTADNETATLAWGESYVMMALASMFRTTGDPAWLDRLAYHADGVLASRDDARGVADWRGVSGACWRDTHYQPNGEPYCYAVHSGMIVYPIAEFARLVAASGLEGELAYDGVSFGDKASAYTAAALETVAFHEFEWTGDWYRFPADATFLSGAGDDVPINQALALGRALVILADLTGDPVATDHAAALADRFRADPTAASDGGWLWNYRLGTYVSPGEDISHGAIDVDFAVLAADHGLAFDDDDVDGFATTFVERVYQDDHTLADHVGGGAGGDASYEPQGALWAPLAGQRTAVYTALRDLYDVEYPAAGVTSASRLLGWALLAEHEPPACEWGFYVADWAEPDADGFRAATAARSNLLVFPPDLGGPCALTVTVDAPVGSEVQQWDGVAYHREVDWAPTGGPVDRRIPYEPRWPFVYADGGVLVQFDYPFTVSDAVRIAVAAPLVPPTITSSPAATVPVGSTFTYAPVGAGDGPYWWLLPTFPTGARIDPVTGAIDWTPTAVGAGSFVVRLWTDVGTVDQAFIVTAVDAATTGSTTGSTTGGATTSEPTAGSTGSTGDADGPSSDPTVIGSEPGGCGCAATGPAPTLGLGLGLAAWLTPRRRARSLRSSRPS
ncbi:MAG: Ig domain-containing protein [Myxococcota bacterium]